MVANAGSAALAHGFAEPGDTVIVIAGLPFGRSGSTNPSRRSRNSCAPHISIPVRGAQRGRSTETDGPDFAAPGEREDQVDLVERRRGGNPPYGAAVRARDRCSLR